MSEKVIMSLFNLKLPEITKDNFKRITHDRGMTMQTVLAAFAESYISDPEKFKIKMEVIDGSD